MFTGMTGPNVTLILKATGSILSAEGAPHAALTKLREKNTCQVELEGAGDGAACPEPSVTGPRAAGAGLRSHPLP